MLDIKKNYFGTFPEFNDKVKTVGTRVIPIYHKGQKLRPVTILESDEVKNRRAAVKAELGLNGKLEKIQGREDFSFDNIAGDPKYFQEVLGTSNLGWEDL